MRILIWVKTTRVITQNCPAETNVALKVLSMSIFTVMNGLGQELNY